MPVRLATHAMNTRFELIMEPASDDHRDAREFRAIGEEVIDEIQLWHKRLNFFARDSEVARINQLASEQPVRIERETFALLQWCATLHAATHDTFDITIAPLMATLGLRQNNANSSEHSHQRWGAQHIQFDEGNATVAFAEPGIQIDLGGIAKGWSLDRAAEILSQHEITNALLHGGTSSVIAIGSPPDKESWTIALRNPPTIHTNEQATRWIVQLNNQALSVSAPHGRAITTNTGRTISHIVDPRTGESAISNAALAAVVCDSAAVADAWSTAMTVLGQRPTDMRNEIATLIARHSEHRKTLDWVKHDPISCVFSKRR